MVPSHVSRRKVLIVWFNDCVLGKSGQIVNPVITMVVDPIRYYSVHVHLSLRIYQL